MGPPLLPSGSAFSRLASLEPLRGRRHPCIVVLDVGCGSCALVAAFIEGDLHGQGRRLVRRGTLDEVDGPLDLVMFHHSLEHMPDPEAPLRQAYERLRPGGYCLVRVPLVSSWAFYFARPP